MSSVNTSYPSAIAISQALRALDPVMTAAGLGDEVAEDEAKKMVLSGRCVALLGAGVSTPPGVPWKKMVDKVAARCGIRQSSLSLPRIIDKCISRDLGSCNRILQESLPHYSNTVRPAMTSLLRLPFRAILTTNFDPWIRSQSMTMFQEGYSIYPDLPLHTGLGKRLYYLHGMFDSMSEDACIRKLVFGERSFNQAYRVSLLEGFLLQVLTYEPMFIVGFDPTEPRFATALKKANRIRGQIAESQGRQTRPRRLVLWPRPYARRGADRVTQTEMIVKLYSLELDVVLYDRDGKTWRGLDRLLARWVADGDMLRRPPPFRSGFDLGAAT